MHALNEIDNLLNASRNLLVDNDDFHRQRVNGHWEAARAPAEYPVAADYIKGPCADLISQLAVILQQARVACADAVRVHPVSENLLRQMDGSTPGELVEDEFQHLYLKLKTLAPRALDRIDESLGQIPKKIDTLTFIHDALFVEACDFCEEVEKSRTFIGLVINDPLAYMNELHNRRWDSANLAFSDELIEGTLSKADPWRQHGNTWTREYQVETASGDKNYGIASVHFRKLHSVPEGIRTTLARPKAEHATGMEMEIS